MRFNAALLGLLGTVYGCRSGLPTETYGEGGSTSSTTFGDGGSGGAEAGEGGDASASTSGPTMRVETPPFEREVLIKCGEHHPPCPAGMACSNRWQGVCE